MKNLVVLLLLLLGTFAQAQESPKSEAPMTKSLIIGGTINYSKLKNIQPLNTALSEYYAIDLNNNSDVTSIDFTPYFGLSISSHWVMGVRLKYQSIKDDYVDYNEENQTDKSSVKGIGLFGRYVFYPESKFNLFLQPKFMINKLKSETNLSIGKYSYYSNFYETGCDLGFSYQVGKRARLTANLGGLTMLKGTVHANFPIIEEEQTQPFSTFTTNMNLANTAFGIEINF